LAEKIAQDSAMLAELEARNTGKPIVEAEFEIIDAATCFEYYSGCRAWNARSLLMCQ
jgi:betaine-aldehyde dehydrogenase